MKFKDIEDLPQTVSGLCNLARRAGYKDPLYRLQNRDGSFIGDLLLFFEDNPGAIEAIYDWSMEHLEIEEEDEKAEDLQWDPLMVGCGPRRLY